MVVWSPLRFNSGQQTENRFAIAPLTTDSSHPDGTVTENELDFIRRRAGSGFGLTISSAAYVEPDGRSWQGIGAAHDGHLSSLRRLAEAMRAAGGLAILQIYDGGRIAKPGLTTKSAEPAALPRSMYRYSSLALQLPPMAASTPAPATQPYLFWSNDTVPN